ncbi:hypothetical protein [Sphingopyxis terrae]|uniref:hypothetical protein n=1 Tax=Sphingopyxis terrae TaxID=33052 RepID=UPI0036289800
MTGIWRSRIARLNDDAEPTPEKIGRVAALWWETPNGLQRSIAESLRAERTDLATSPD